MNGVRWSRLKPNKPRIGRVAQSVAAALICFGALGVATAVRAEAPTGVYTYTVHNDTATFQLLDISDPNARDPGEPLRAEELVHGATPGLRYAAVR